jgi:magnesium transporter
MIFRYEYQGGVWVDLEQPSREEIQQIAHEFSLSERIEKELVSPTPIPLVASDGGTTLLVLHFPAHDAGSGETGSQEIDFVVGAHCILTIRYEVIAPLYHLKKQLETQKLVAPHTLVTADVLFEILFVHLYTSVRDHINHVVDHLARVERDMFDGSERTTVRLISNVSREFLHMEAALANQEEPLGRFLNTLGQQDFFNASFAERAQHILEERTQIARLVTTHRAVAGELRETNIALLEAGQNEIMKTLTIINIIFLPLGLISWIFAMRTEGMPLIDSPNAFWIVLAFMLGIAIFLTTLFIKRRWLF